MGRFDDNPLRLARLRAGFTQTDLARAAGINRNVVVTVEQGTVRTPAPATLEALSRILAVPTGTLTEQLQRWNAMRPTEFAADAAEVFALDPAELPARFASFVDWRRAVAPSRTVFARSLRVATNVVKEYEDGQRRHGMPDSLTRALLGHVGADYLLVLGNLPTAPAPAQPAPAPDAA